MVTDENVGMCRARAVVGTAVAVNVEALDNDVPGKITLYVEPSGRPKQPPWLPEVTLRVAP